MKPWYNQNDCEHLAAHHAYYPVAVVAMLWCKVPPDQVQDELNRSTPHPSIRGVLTHPYIPCLLTRCKIIHDAIESGALPASREAGRVTAEHIAPERRYVSRENLKAWIANEYPADKPEFLFDEIERSTHAAINKDAFLSLQADRDALRSELEKARTRASETIGKMSALQGERDSLASMVEKMNAPGARAETTYLNIIGGLLGLMLGRTPAGQPQSAFLNQGAIISALLAHHEGRPGIAVTTLENKFAEANRSIKAT